MHAKGKYNVEGGKLSFYFKLDVGSEDMGLANDKFLSQTLIMAILLYVYEFWCPCVAKSMWEPLEWVHKNLITNNLRVKNKYPILDTPCKINIVRNGFGSY